MTNTTPNTIKLTDTQTFVLNAAADHAQGRIEIFPDNVKGGARAKVLAGLQAKGWIKASGTHWKITKAGLAAIGRNLANNKTDDDSQKTSIASKPPKADKPIKVRQPSKQDLMMDLLKRDGGVTLPDLMSATGWQQHSVRGCLSKLNKAQGGAIQSAKRDGQRVYWIDAASFKAASIETVSETLAA
jgi:hypothetical protein